MGDVQQQMRININYCRTQADAQLPAAGAYLFRRWYAETTTGTGGLCHVPSRAGKTKKTREMGAGQIRAVEVSPHRQ